jgi:hypothetical protein
VYASFNAESDTDLRYDLILLALLDGVSLRWPAIDTSKILLTAFLAVGNLFIASPIFTPSDCWGSVSVPREA